MPSLFKVNVDMIVKRRLNVIKPKDIWKKNTRDPASAIK